jgi:hypothetical protein
VVTAGPPRGRPPRVGLGLAVLAAAHAVLLPAPAAACAVCVDWGREWQGLNAGFYWSAVFLTALPFVLVGAAGLWLRRLAAAAAPRPGAGAERSAPAPPG